MNTKESGTKTDEIPRNFRILKTLQILWKYFPVFSLNYEFDVAN